MMNTSELMKALSDAGAPFEAILIAVRALEERDAAISARDDAAAAKRAVDAARKREERGGPKMSKDSPRTKREMSTDTLPPNEYISNPPSKTSSPDGDGPLSPDFGDQVVETWNAKIPGTPLPTARKLNPDRRKHLRCRVAEHGEAAVFTAISNMIQSDFHSGRSGKWTEGNLGWLLKSPENFLKMLERSPPVSAAVQEAWTEERKAEMLAKWNSGQPAANPEHPPPRQDRKPTAFGAPIGQFVRQIASKGMAA